MTAPARGIFLPWSMSTAQTDTGRSGKLPAARALRDRCGSTTSARSGARMAQFLLELLASRCAAASDSLGVDREREEHDRPASVESRLTRCGARRCARARAARSRARRAVGSDAAGRAGERPLERLEMGLHVRDARALRGSPARRARRSRVRLAGRARPGTSGAARRSTRAVLLEDRDVVRLLHPRLGQRDREHAVAQVEARAARLDVHDDVAARQRGSTASSIRSAAWWPSTTAWPGGTRTTTSAK